MVKTDPFRKGLRRFARLWHDSADTKIQPINAK